MLQELLPRDAPKPGYRKALFRHAGPGLVSPKRTRPCASDPPGNTTPGEKGRQGDGRQRAAGSQRGAGESEAGCLGWLLFVRLVTQPRWADSPEAAAAGVLGSLSPALRSWFPYGLLSGLHRRSEVKGHRHGAGRPSPASARPGHPTPDSRHRRGEAVAG